MANVKLKGKDILLLLMYYPGKDGSVPGGIVGTTRLIKAMFLFEKEIKKNFKAEIKDYPEFLAWKFGPWSAAVADDIEFFKRIDFISSTNSSEDDPSSNIAVVEEKERWREELLEVQSEDDFNTPECFQLTDTGVRYVESNLITQLSPEQQKLMAEFKAKIASLSLFSLLSYVYKKYSKGDTDYTANSEIKAEITGS